VVSSEHRLETGHPLGLALGTGSTSDDVVAILDAHEAVLPTIRSAEAAICEAIDLVVSCLARSGRLLYVGAGTSGWLAALDAAEVVVTYGMKDRVASLVGGGSTLDPIAMTIGDDAIDSIDDDVSVAQCTEGDVVLAVSASGRTPFTLAAVERVRAQGSRVIALVNEAGSALSALADVVVCIPIDGEVVAGSTRLTAGLAQKVVLNTVSTAAMVRLGRSLNGQMVCLVPLNDKLRQRLVVAVSTASGADERATSRMLAECGEGDVAVVALVAGVSVAEARDRLVRHAGSIPEAIAE
jgi:N-acetylmuramic acid 6-phosphate etherase